MADGGSVALSQAVLMMWALDFISSTVMIILWFNNIIHKYYFLTVRLWLLIKEMKLVRISVFQAILLTLACVSRTFLSRLSIILS